jgi:hypothetical protein
MTDQPTNPDRLDELLRDAAVTYNRPPDERDMPLEAIWQVVDSEAFPRRAFGLTSTARRMAYGANAASRHLRGFLIPAVAAAALLIGIGIGRMSLGSRAALGTVRLVESAAVKPLGAVMASAPTPAADTPSQPFDAATARYLGQTAALLIALPSETSNSHPDQRFIVRANELLLTTRLLLDSQAAAEPSLRNLLEDLELVLVQVVRLQNERAHSRQTDLELIQQALDQHDVMPRLRTAVSEHAADD